MSVVCADDRGVLCWCGCVDHSDLVRAGGAEHVAYTETEEYLMGRVLRKVGSRYGKKPVVTGWGLDVVMGITKRAAGKKTMR